MKLKELNPPSNARYVEGGELELGDGTFVSIYRYPEGEIRVQTKNSDPMLVALPWSILPLHQGTTRELRSSSFPSGTSSS
jgi:hypothetical protein